MISHVLVATDGRPDTAGALRLAQLLSERNEATVEVLAVQEPVDLYAADYPIMAPGIGPELLQQSAAAIRDAVRQQLEAVGGGATNWTVTLQMGRPARVIARLAADRDVDLILIGLRQPKGVERWLGRDTLLTLSHLAHVPVLAAKESATSLPHVAVAAVDFSDFSLRAARFALACMAEDGVLHLTHATGFSNGSDRWPASAEWHTTYRAGVEQRLQEVADQLGGTRMEIRTHVIAGDPRKEILEFARAREADLIVTGSHGAGFFGRIVMGSVSSELVHGSPGSVLVAPPQEVPGEL
jgi:uncharacterized protein